MDSNPALFGSANGELGASCSEQFPPEELSVTMAIPDGVPNSATYTPPPFPVSLIKPSPAR
jgi:hypothetical protein